MWLSSALVALLAALAVSMPGRPSAGASAGRLAAPRSNKQAMPGVTLHSLLAEMTDRDAIARWPQPVYRCLQASSYDRAQTDPNNPVTWHANNDFGQFLRTEDHAGRREWVILDHDGPGVITRFWTPLWDQRRNQVVRFYLDGSPTPAIEARFEDLISGRGFVKPPLAFVAWNQQVSGPESAIGGDFYLPIPFARSCKITLNELPFYYNINYRAYPPGTRVQSFSLADFGTAAAALDRAAQRLQQSLTPAAPTASAGTAAVRQSPVVRMATLAPGHSVTLDLPDGSFAVRTLQVRLLPSRAVPASDAVHAVSAHAPLLQPLRSVVVTAVFDGEPTVWCPLGGFFGCGVRLSPVNDWYRSVDADGTMTSRWVMPYQRSGRIALQNLGRTPIRICLSASVSPWKWDSRSLHFHTTWRRQYPLSTRPMSDWNYVTIRGQGIYAGDTLTVMNPRPDWFGEGDERVYVDGEKFPSQLGTGTEDYYGYAWGMADRFDSPFIAMPLRDGKGKGDWTGYTTVSRMRLLDGIPFTRSLRFDMEIWHWADCQEDYAATTFWYARPGAVSNRAPAVSEASRALESPPGPLHVAGALECETMAITARSPDIPIGPQILNPFQWSGGAQLFVQARQPGDFVELRFPAAGAGRQRLLLYATRSYDYGILRFSVNGRPVPAPFDGYSAAVLPPTPIDLGVFEPQNGQFNLRVEVAGSNPAAKGTRCYFGLDCIVRRTGGS